MNNKEESDLMQELQSLWNWQDDRLAELSACPEAQPRGLDVRGGLFFRPEEAHAHEQKHNFWRYAAAAAIAALLAVGLWIFNTRQADEEPVVAHEKPVATSPEALLAVDSEVVLSQEEQETKTEYLLRKPSSAPGMPGEESLTASVQEELQPEVTTHADELPVQPHAESADKEVRLGFGEPQAVRNDRKMPDGMASSLISDMPSQHKSNMVEVRLGFAELFDHSAVSLATNAEGIAQAPSLSAVIGRRPGGFMYGLACNFAFADMSAQDNSEWFFRGGISVVLRNYYMLAKNVSYYAGLEVGLSAMHNSIKSADEAYGVNRCGIMAEVEAGLQVDVTEKVYVGLGAGLGLDRPFDKNVELPETFPANENKPFGNFTLSVTVGTKF